MKIRKFVFTPVYENGEQICGKLKKGDYAGDANGTDIWQVKHCNTVSEYSKFTRTEEEEEIPDPPKRKKLCVEIEYENVFLSEVGLRAVSVQSALNGYLKDLNATVKEIEAGWTDEDMEEFARYYENYLVNRFEALANFKKKRGK